MKKKFVVALLACILSISSVACGNTSQKKESSTKQTAQSSSKKKSGKKDVANAKKDTSSDDDENLSQAEWVQKYASEDGTEDGYKIVNKINMTYNDINISFDHTEKYTKKDGSQIILVYFKFANNSNQEASPATYFNTLAFQNGQSIGLASYSLDDESKDVYINNELKEVSSGESILFAQEIDIEDWVSPVKIRVNDANVYNQDMSKQQLQQQEINLQ